MYGWLAALRWWEFMLCCWQLGMSKVHVDLPGCALKCGVDNTTRGVQYWGVMMTREAQKDTKNGAFKELLLIRPATWLHFVHEIAVPISQSPQRNWWGLVLAKTCPVRWVTLCNIQIYFLGRCGSLIVHTCVNMELYASRYIVVLVRCLATLNMNNKLCGGDIMGSGKWLLTYSTIQVNVCTACSISCPGEVLCEGWMLFCLGYL